MLRIHDRITLELMRGPLAALMLASSAINADTGRDKAHDQELVRRALEQGEVRPFIEILQLIRARIDGEIVKTEFKKEDGLWVYEIKYITKSGRMREIYVDALTAQTLKAEDH